MNNREGYNMQKFEIKPKKIKIVRFVENTSSTIKALRVHGCTQASPLKRGLDVILPKCLDLTKYNSDLSQNRNFRTRVKI